VAVIPYRANALVRHSNPLTPRWLLPPALWITARLGNSLARSEIAKSPETNRRVSLGPKGPIRWGARSRQSCGRRNGLNGGQLCTKVLDHSQQRIP
jgi:hypothetical protein